MANHKSAKKMINVISKRTLINKMRMNKTRTSIKKLLDAIAAGDHENLTLLFRNAESNIHKCAGKGVIHKNAAARKISRLNAKVKTVMITQ